MRKSTLFFATAALAMMSAVAFAGPFASRIAMDSTTVAESQGTTITYVLNEGADSVSIEIKNSANATVATFAGTATQGLNTVIWNGTVDNAGGAAVPAGTGYYAAITVNVTSNPAFHKYAENLSGAGGNGQVFAGFSPNVVLNFADQLSDNFGVVLAGSSFAPYSSGIQFRTDLLTLDGANGLSDRGPIHPSDPGGVENGSLWGLAQDPDDENILWGVGQDGTVAQQWFRGDVTSGIAGSPLALADHPTTPAGGLFPRNCAIWKNGVDKYLLFTRSNGVLGRIKLGATTFEPATPGPDFSGNLLALAVPGQYSKDVKVDENGNVYWVAKLTAPAPFLYRWDFADVQAAPGVPLTEANATWAVDFPTTVTNAMGVNFTNGRVYVATATVASTGQIYDLGPTSQASVVGIAGVSVGTQLTSGLNNPDVNTTYSALGADAFGNLIAFDRSSERIQAYTTGGNSSYTVRAPLSQVFDIVTPPLKVGDWMVH